MKHSFLLALLLASFVISNAQVVLRNGMKIAKSVVVKKAVYQFSSNDLSSPSIIIEGNNITVDFKGALLTGSKKEEKPDEFTGLAILLKGKNITVKNLSAKGFKVALMARNVDGLKIENCDFSYNYRQHLNSTQEKEDISDWMSYHHNENDEWLRYGAAMYLRGCNNAVITNTKVTGGQNALMMTACNNGLIYNNSFVFNSGIGIGMYKSSFNRVLYNNIDFNVRGYSHGVYNRGQDSAGILVYEQSNNNTFYKNSVTHGGDGFFLWAGQYTMDTGKGGCNDNLLLKNDFSYAPTNGVEVTFSRNKIIANRIFECDHGIWGGYSYQTRISNNQFRNNRIAIAIEHGQYDTINHNLFIRDKEGIRLWARKQQPTDWGYAKYRDTKSHDYLIAANSLNDLLVGMNISRTDSIYMISNQFYNVVEELKVDSTVGFIDSTISEEVVYRLSDEIEATTPDVKKPNDPFRVYGKLAGRENILMTEWGPYNFQYPLIWHDNPVDTSKMNFRILGPNGRWKFINVRGIEMQLMVEDSIPVAFSAQKIPGEKTDIEIIAEYTGPPFTDPFGRHVRANTPYRFSYRKFFQPVNFTVSWYPFDSLRNPITTNYLEHIKTQRPFKTEQVNRLDYAWWGGIKVGDITYQQFLTIAEGDAVIDVGRYEIAVTWDDAIRLYVDDKLVIDEWNPSKYKFDESPHKKVAMHLGGRHHFRVEHVELGGFATLSLKLKKL